MKNKQNGTKYISTRIAKKKDLRSEINYTNNPIIIIQKDLCITLLCGANTEWMFLFVDGLYSG